MESRVLDIGFKREDNITGVVRSKAVRSGLENIGGDSKYSKVVVCSDDCVMFRLTAKKIGNKNF